MKKLSAIIVIIAVALTSGCGGSDEKTIQGTVQVLPKKLDGTWIVHSGGCDGKPTIITVTPATRIEGGEGAALVGASVEITGQNEGHYLLASDIKVHPSAVSMTQENGR